MKDFVFATRWGRLFAKMWGFLFAKIWGNEVTDYNYLTYYKNNNIKVNFSIT